MNSSRLNVAHLIVGSFPQQPFSLTGAAQEPTGQSAVWGGETRWEVHLYYSTFDLLVPAVPQQKHTDTWLVTMATQSHRHHTHQKELTCCSDASLNIFTPGNLERECMEEMCDQEEAREVFEQPDTTVPPCCAAISSHHHESWIQ